MDGMNTYGSGSGANYETATRGGKDQPAFLVGGHGFHGERAHFAHRVGKNRAGRLLDGVLHDGYPEGKQ